MQKKNADSLQASVLGGRGYVIGDQKSNDILPKIDKIEMLLHDQQSATIQVDEELQKH